MFSCFRWLSLRSLPENLPFALFDGVELRLDQLRHLSLTTICDFVRHLRMQGKRCILTHVQDSMIQAIIREPKLIDVFIDTPLESSLVGKVPAHRRILSFHNFNSTPKDLKKLWHVMSRIEAYHYKIATWVTSTSEALKMVLFAQDHPNLTVVPMGPIGRPMRCIAAALKTPFVYLLPKNDQQPTCQLNIEEWVGVQEVEEFTALLGWPISHSLSEIVYSECYRRWKMKAVHCKLAVRPHEVFDVLNILWQLPCIGLSITMPLKEIVAGYVNCEPIAEQIGAVNALKRGRHGWDGFNTDALSAAALLRPWQGKRALLLGAGGAARAVFWALKSHAIATVVVNRSHRPWIKGAKVTWCDYEKQWPKWDLLINATSLGMFGEAQLPCIERLEPYKIVFDLVYRPRYTQLLQRATELQCSVVDGLEFFIWQALFFFEKLLHKQATETQAAMLRAYIENYLVD